MSYQATVISVMIASPGDVRIERQILREVIHSWNDLHSKERRCVVLPVGWETHSAPSLGARPQQLINDRVLHDCDLLVGVFWTRLGTPTGEADSGTVEEIKEHLRQGKPVMVYFSSAPAAPESIDPDQYAKLVEFRSWCETQGLIHRFDNAQELREHFSLHLQLNLRDDPYLKSLQRSSAHAPDVASTEDHESDEEEYNLSDEAKTLLIQASKDKAGILLWARHLGGDVIQANGINWVEAADARGLARWRAAVEQLEFNVLIEDRSGKSSVFYVTDDGFRYADRLLKMTEEHSS